jgi:hypothetical protein
LLAASAVATTAGIALSVGGWEAIGSVVTVAGLLAMVAALHRFGRLGPDPSTGLPSRGRRSRRNRPS